MFLTKNIFMYTFDISRFLLTSKMTITTTNIRRQKQFSFTELIRIVQHKNNIFNLIGHWFLIAESFSQRIVTTFIKI